MWTGITVPYTRVYEQYGLDFVLQPANLLSFVLTIFGLLAVAITGLTTTMPLIKKKLIQPNLTRVGLVLMGLGGYFVITSIYSYLTGGYSAYPSVRYEV